MCRGDRGRRSPEKMWRRRGQTLVVWLPSPPLPALLRHCVPTPRSPVHAVAHPGHSQGLRDGRVSVPFLGSFGFTDCAPVCAGREARAQTPGEPLFGTHWEGWRGRGEQARRAAPLVTLLIPPPTPRSGAATARDTVSSLRQRQTGHTQMSDGRGPR